MRGVCYWKALVMQAELYAKLCKMCQQFKHRKAIYGHLPTNNIVEPKLWNSVHLYLIVTYSKSTR